MVVQTTTAEHKLYVRSGLGYLLEAVSTNGGKDFDELRPTIFRSSRTSFNIRAHEDEPNTFYMAWEYNAPGWSYLSNGEIFGTSKPRTRVGLAVSTDSTRSWKFVGDVDEFGQNESASRHSNHTLSVAGNYLWVTTERDDYANANDMRFWRFDITKFEPSARFPGTH